MSDQENKEGIENFDLGTLQKILFRTKNDEAIAEIEKELSSIDTLSQRLDNHASKLLDLMEDDDDSKPQRLNSKSTRKPSTVYVSSQIANMISMKSHKLALLKHKENLSTSSLDRAMKILVELNKNKGDDRELPLDQVLALLLAKNVTIPTNSKFLDAVEILSSVDLDADDELDRIIEANNIPSLVFNEENIPQVVEPTKIFLETNTGKLFLVDDDYTILSEIDEDSLDVDENEEGVYFCNNHNLPIESDE